LVPAGTLTPLRRGGCKGRRMKLPGALDYAGRRVLLKFRKFGCGLGHHPPNCLAALDEALEGGAEDVEFDVRLLGDNRFVLFRGDQPANCLAALDEALEGGADVAEIDVRRLGDNPFVLPHGATRERETGGLGSVSGLDSRDLGSVRVRGGPLSPAVLAHVVNRL